MLDLIDLYLLYIERPLSLFSITTKLTTYIHFYSYSETFLRWSVNSCLGRISQILTSLQLPVIMLNDKNIENPLSKYIRNIRFFSQIYHKTQSNIFSDTYNYKCKKQRQYYVGLGTEYINNATELYPLPKMFCTFLILSTYFHRILLQL